MSQANCRVKEISRSSIDQDGEGWPLIASHDSADPVRVEAKTLKGPLKKAFSISDRKPIPYPI